MTRRPHPKYASNDARQGPWTTCDICGFVWSQNSMAFQYDYRGGAVPINTGFLKCPKCMDDLDYQHKLIILPADPPPKMNLRPEPYAVDETDFLLADTGAAITAETGTSIVTDSPDPTDTDANTVNFVTTIFYHQGSVGVAYLDLLQGQTAASGTSVLAAISGSATRPNIASQLAAVSGIAQNTTPIVIAAASVGNNINVNFAAIYSAVSGGSPLASAPVSVLGNFVQTGALVQFDSLGLTINLN